MTSNARAFWNASIAILGLSGLAMVPPSAPMAESFEDCPCGDDAEFGVYGIEELPVDHHPILQQIPEKLVEEHPQTAPVVTSVQWQPFNLETVQAARDAGKVLWIHVVHDGCGPCEKLKPIFKEPAFVTRVGEQLVAVQVDRFKGAGPAVVDAFNAGGDDPVDLFVLPNGRYLRYIGAPKDLAAYFNRLVSFPGYANDPERCRLPDYPDDGNKPWTLKGRSVGANHLNDHKNHAGKFPADYVANLSAKGFEQLHADDHDNTVRWEFVPPVEATR